jgi:hypothetical protein
VDVLSPDTTAAAEGVATPREAPDLTAVAAIADALGMMFAAYQLYPEPASTPAWERAMERFRASDAYPAIVDITPDAFAVGTEVLASTVDGAARIARALFVHEVAAVAFPAPPAAPDLLRLFECAVADPTETVRSGGVRAILKNAGVSSVEVVSRAPLEERDDTMEAGRHSDVKEIVDGGVDPATVAERVTVGAPEPETVTERFTTWYEDVLGKVEAEDFMAREAVVTVFAEAFFHLDPDQRLSILEYCLAMRAKPEYQVLMDQFSGHDLAAMSGDLSAEARGDLVEYARTSFDDGRPAELIAMLQSPAEVDEARRAVAGRIAELLDADGPSVGRGATFARIRNEIAAVPAAHGMGRRVLRDLLAVEVRDGRFRRLLRIWTGKIARAIHEGDLADGELWLDACLADPTYPPERQPEVDEALAAMATDELIATLLGDVEGTSVSSFAMRLIGAWGTRVVDRLVAQLADEEDPARRRAYIDVIAAVSSADASGLLQHLSDGRWYLVRNLAIACGKAGRAETAPRLRSLAAGHADHRVRVEALRALPSVSLRQGIKAAVKALRDDHKRVRQAALAVLAAADSEDADEAMTGALESKEVEIPMKLQIIEVLGERSTPGARAALEGVAGRRSLVGPARSLRQAAQQALRSSE